mmetsp:Transcript_29145/g.49681  ORF Transcript_29145/g.49681 Transcript_29145/m.49681 type:complete len:364 (-) Transcript_29145:442-1533(-)
MVPSWRSCEQPLVLASASALTAAAAGQTAHPGAHPMPLGRCSTPPGASTHPLKTCAGSLSVPCYHRQETPSTVHQWTRTVLHNLNTAVLQTQSVLPPPWETSSIEQLAVPPSKASGSNRLRRSLHAYAPAPLIQVRILPTIHPPVLTPSNASPKAHNLAWAMASWACPAFRLPWHPQRRPALASCPAWVASRPAFGNLLCWADIQAVRQIPAVRRPQLHQPARLPGPSLQRLPRAGIPGQGRRRFAIGQALPQSALLRRPILLQLEYFRPASQRLLLPSVGLRRILGRLRWRLRRDLERIQPMDRQTDCFAAHRVRRRMEGRRRLPYSHRLRQNPPVLPLDHAVFLLPDQRLHRERHRGQSLP